jgi:hypothetical protein
MKNLSDFTGQTLVIHQPSFWKKYYELRCGDEVIGKFSFSKPFSSQLSVELFSGRWKIYQPSFWNSLVAIKAAGELKPFANYKRFGFKSYGVLDLPEDNHLKIVFKFFRSGYEIQTTWGESLVIFKEMVSFKSRAGILINKRSELLDKYPWTVALLWYLAYRKRRSAAAH